MGRTLAGRHARLPQVTRHQTDPINRILIEHIETIAGKRLRTSAYVLASQMATASR
jgi:hypothetical protein